MSQLLACALVFGAIVVIIVAYQLWAMRTLRSTYSSPRKRLIVSIGAGVTFGAIVTGSALIYGGQRGWGIGTAVALGAGALILSALGLYIALLLSRDDPV